MIQRFEFSAAAHLADELLHLGEQVHAPGSDVEADEQPQFAEAAHLAFALAEQLADLRKIEDWIAFELAPVILHEVYDLEDLFDRPQDAGQVIRVLISIFVGFGFHGKNETIPELVYQCLNQLYIYITCLLPEIGYRYDIIDRGFRIF